MVTDPVVKEVTLKAPVEKVWRAITDKEEMKGWYFSVEEFRAEPGFKFKMYGEKKGVKFPISCIIREVQPMEKLSYSWSYDDFPAETLVTFELQEQEGQTQLRLSHQGLETIPPKHTDVSKQNHIEGWDFIIGTSLKQYLEDESAD